MENQIRFVFPPPKAVWICRSSPKLPRRSSSRWDAFFTPVRSKRSFCAFSWRKKATGAFVNGSFLFWSSSATTSLKNSPWMFMMKWTGEKRMQVEFYRRRCCIPLLLLILFFYYCWSYSCIIADRIIVYGTLLLSVAGHAKPQHACDGHHGCALSACQPRVLIHQEPGVTTGYCKLLLQVLSPDSSLFPLFGVVTIIYIFIIIIKNI